jgi:hypothetical protein
MKTSTQGRRIHPPSAVVSRFRLMIETTHSAVVTTAPTTMEIRSP